MLKKYLNTYVILQNNLTNHVISNNRSATEN